MIRLAGWLFGLFSFAFIVVVGGGALYLQALTSDLPDYHVLKDYAPAVTTRVEAQNGILLAEYARQRRLFQPVDTMPPLVIDAFISAEDKTFYTNEGISPDGIIRAIRDNVMARLNGDDRSLVGASTITQQVAKNFLLSSAQTWDRKIKEVILALRINATFSKDKILELYLNEIFLGSINGNTYGVAAAALNYFDKSLYQLSLSEIAYLAGLPKGPNNYNPFTHPHAAIARRNYVLDRMADNGYITPAERDAAEKQSLHVVPRPRGNQLYAAEYFSEEVRRQLLQRYGAAKVYGGGLSVRTTLDPQLQKEARKALMDGLVAYDRRHGVHARVGHVSLDKGSDWGTSVYAISPLSDVPEWQLAVVLGTTTGGLEIGLRPASEVDHTMAGTRITGTLADAASKWAGKPMAALFKPGDVVYVSAVPGQPGTFGLEQVPRIEGALVAMDPQTGRVEALVGGFSYAQSQFNRATQAMRQPGSSFKPIVYSAALENGYTPASIVLDAPIEIRNADGTVYKPENYEKDYRGPQTLRRGLELSRNVMTVRLAQDIGMSLVVDYAKRFGIYDHLLAVPSMALGAGETTDLKMTAAYATIANGGRKVTPTLIDRIQDRYGKTIYRHDRRVCDGCNATGWHNQAEPIIIDNRPYVLDPATAYQITSMMEGVVQRGTGTYVKRLQRPVAGKTGTSSDFKDAWFIGFTPQLVCGVYIGFDTPRDMGRGETGGVLAAPIFTAFMAAALKDKPVLPFTVPPGITQTWVDPATGVAASRGGNAILEAFKTGTGPNLPSSMIGIGPNPNGHGNAFISPDRGPAYDNGGYQGGGYPDNGPPNQYDQGRGGLF